MPRPAKNPPTEAEWIAIQGQGDRKAAAIISELRGANLGSISGLEASRRRVSHEWVAQQRKTKLRQNTKPSENLQSLGDTMPSENTQATGNGGPRITREVSRGENARVQQTGSDRAAADQVVAKGPEAV